MKEKIERKALTTLSREANEQVKRVRTIDNYISQTHNLKGYYINLSCELMSLLTNEQIENHLKSKL